MSAHTPGPWVVVKSGRLLVALTGCNTAGACAALAVCRAGGGR